MPGARPLRTLRRIAVEAAERAAEVIATSELHEVVATKSTDTDIVTETDIAAERAVRAVFAERTPGARLLGEESGRTIVGEGGWGDVEWIVDPLDGTVNFSYRIPIAAVSVAAAVHGRVAAGAVVDVARGELFSAHLGGGATLDGAGIVVGDRDDLGMALVATGFSYEPERRRAHGRTVADLLAEVRDIRAFGSAALHLCWVACGRIDAYAERDIKPWDYAAGGLIATEAGARLELPCFENDRLVLVANRALSSALRPKFVVDPSTLTRP